LFVFYEKINPEENGQWIAMGWRGPNSGIYALLQQAGSSGFFLPQSDKATKAFFLTSDI